jgi:hypothetical protein
MGSEGNQSNLLIGDSSLLQFPEHLREDFKHRGRPLSSKRITTSLFLLANHYGF